MAKEARKIAGKKILGNVWEIDRRKLTPELEKKYEEIRRSYARGIARRQEKRERKRRKAEKELRGFLVVY